MPAKDVKNAQGGGDPLTTEVVNRALIIRFTRPEMRNPLSVDVLERLDQLVDDVRPSASIDRIIFTGEEDVFASGADLREIAAVSPENAHGFALRGQQIMTKIAALPQT